ncbi:methyl-accepting chemotaxis protein [Chromobacterium amazonense]|uniref:Methyl-accepting chemotaxis protein n=1 Tax=Chromobacterium amazonense TaxID=1382803 RepID=A0ABU8V6R1_9NEIS|nr:methyl-accepting chemotaxis protein [Chromobacterium amazonense]MDQ4539913.1 methyl-accepting chemotaxis protein [Chromobacterium amazonense]
MRSLRVKLIAFIALLLVVLGVVITILVYGQMRNEIIQGVENELDGTSKGYAGLVASWYKSKVGVVIAANPLVAEQDPRQTLARLSQAGGFDMTYIGTAQHVMIRSDMKPQPQGYDPVARPWYQQAAASGNPGVSDPYVDFDTKKLVVTFVSPVKDGSGLKAVVGGDIFIDDLVKTVLSVKLRGNGYAFLVDKTGKVIAHPDASLTLKPLTEKVPELTGDRLTQLAASNGMVPVQIGGENKLVEVQPVEGTNWLLGVVTDEAVVTNPLRTLLLTIIGLGAVCVVILAVVASVILSKMLSGLGRLRGAMLEISQGEGDLTRRIQVSGQDEIAETATAFNRFIDQLQKMFLAVKEEAERVTNGVESVTHTVDKVAHDSRQIADVSSSNAATLEQITVSISHIADAAREADTLVNHTGDVSSESASGMLRISNEMNSTVDAVKGLSSMLASLDQRSQQISGITNVIKDIADQTNLLALNAAIEAARAGEMGRGFAVVADEVRKLAERTGQATVEISGMVSTIREETSQAVNNMQRTVNSVDGGVELTQSAVERIEQIQQAMQEVMAKMNEITLSTSEQHKATTLIAQSTEQINGRIVDSDDALQTVRDTLSSLTQSANNMRQLFSSFHV